SSFAGEPSGSRHGRPQISRYLAQGLRSWERPIRARVLHAVRSTRRKSGPNDYQTCGVYAQIGQLERTWSSDHRLDEAESVHGWNQSPDRGDRVTDSSKTVRLPATLAKTACAGTNRAFVDLGCKLMGFYSQSRMWG